MSWEVLYAYQVLLIPALNDTKNGVKNTKYIDMLTEVVVRARECFCSRTGYMLVAADFQQTELRVLAHLSQDAVLLAGFRQPNPSNTDIFKQLSATW